jgi:hypothetical protein
MNTHFGLVYGVHAETKEGQYETATFTVADVGLLYKAGVFQSGDPASIADTVAVSTDFQKNVPPQMVTEEKVSTQFGEGLLRVYRLTGGALIAPVKSGNVTMTRAGHPRTSDTPPDGFVAVLVVPQGTRLIFATEEDDFFGDAETHPTEEWQKHLKEGVQALLASMKLQK